MEVQQGSLVDRLRQKNAQERSAKKSLTLTVPGWSGMIRVEYAPIKWDEIAELLESADAKTAADGLAENLQALGEACRAILVCEDGESRSLADALRSQGEEVHGEVTFATVAEILDLKVKDEGTGEERAPQDRDEAVLALFSGAVSPELSVTEQAAKLAAWMMGRQVETDEETLGKN